MKTENLRIKLYKKVCFFGMFFCIVKGFSLSLNELTEITLQNNSDIIAAQNSYDCAILSLKTLNGTYAPQISFSSSSTLPNKYKWDTTPDYFSSSVIYSQPLPGGTSIEITGGTSFTSKNILEERYISQNPNISFSLSQSLLPFWIQGKLKNPEKLSASQQKEYCYYQLLYTKKTVLQNLVQNYIYTLIYEKQIQSYENSILLIDKQIEVVKELMNLGATSQAKITELQNSKWNYQQDLLSVQASFLGYIQNLKTICGSNFDESFLLNEYINLSSTDDFITKLIGITDNISDPLEKSYQLKIDILKTKRILEKQNSAPILSISVQPTWNLEQKKQNDWKDAWQDLNSPTSWSTTVNVNLSPLISATATKSKKQFNLDYESAENSYNAYLIQKNFVLQQYQTILKQYKLQSKKISNLYKTGMNELQDLQTQYKEGAISMLDYDSVKVQIENCKLNMEIIELYIWLYEVLLKINQ